VRHLLDMATSDEAWQLSDDEFEAALALDPDQRNLYFMKYAIATDAIWLLTHDDEVALLETDHGLCVPLWPHPRFARAAMRESWEGHEPRAVPLDEWEYGWVPQLAESGWSVMVFPLPDGTGVEAELDELREQLEDVRGREWDLTEDEYEAALALDAAERYAYLIEHARAHGAMWTLLCEGDVATAEGGALIPLWPHPRYAKAAATDEWAEYEPVLVPLHLWQESWLPELAREGGRALVFPRPDGSGWTTDFDELTDELLADTWRLEPGELERVSGLSSWERYAYFLEHVAEADVLWVLMTGEELGVGGSQGGPLQVAVWPHRRFARAAVGTTWERWDGYEPEPVALEEWWNSWVPRLAERSIEEALVFRVPDDDAVVVQLEQLRHDLARQRVQPEGRRFEPRADDELTVEELYAEGWALDAEEAARLLALDDAERYAFFLEVVGYWRVCWMLVHDNETATFSGDPDCVPLWPHPALAKAAAKGKWAECRPQAVALDEFADWTSWAAAAGYMVSVFPSTHSRGTVRTPNELAADLGAPVE
jgi:hypothetical protein